MIRLLPLLLLGSSAGMTSFPQSPPSAQVPASDTTRRDARNDERGTATDQKHSDSILATCLFVDSNNQVTLAEMAKQKATDPDVKQLAQKVIDDHRQLSQKLQPFASTTLATIGATSDRSKQSKQPQEASSGASMGDFDHAALSQELGE